MQLKCTLNAPNFRSFERHKLHGCAATSDAEHIYEEIDEWPSGDAKHESDESDVDEDHEEEEISFLNLISHERRNHLRYYGCTGWDWERFYMIEAKFFRCQL